MPVYLPTAVVGNSRLLVTLGRSAEIMSFFYPRIDFPQNVYECMTACYFHLPDKKDHFCWTFEQCWEKKQQYIDEIAPIVRTRLTHSHPPLELIITDLVSLDEDVFLREFEWQYPSQRGEAILYQYFDLSLGEAATKDSVRYVPELGAMIQYWRDVCFAVGGDIPDQFQCGKATAWAWANAKTDMVDGKLGGNIQDIGDVNFALGWKLKVRKDQRSRFFIACDRNESEAQRKLATLIEVPTKQLIESCLSGWKKVSKSLEKPELEDGALRAVYHRAVMSLHLLRDAGTGSFIAAPEFDPNFERSGGYGYCWPRDASEAVTTFLQSGKTELAKDFFSWCKRAQSYDGHWNQRYWLDGQLAPAWCLFEDFNQIDQTASVLFAFAKWWQNLEKEAKKEAWSEFGPMLHRGAEALTQSVSSTGLHQTACDLWETFRGTFTYSNAAISAALKAVADIAEQMGEKGLAGEWREAAFHVKQSILERLWLGEGFARGINPEGKVDSTPDSSILGLVEPFQVLDLEVEEEREVAEKMVATLRKTLEHQLPGGPAIHRFQKDSYLGSAAGALNTLWLARTLLVLARYCEEKKAHEYLQAAQKYIRTVISHTTETGLLPELIGVSSDTPYWAAPHLWASASFIMGCFRLAEAKKALLGGDLD